MSKDKDYKCSYCNKEFQNGELVAVSKNGQYHNFHPERDEHPLDCMSKQVFATEDVLIANRKIYFNKKFYDLSHLRRIATKNGSLRIEFNESKTGDIFKGNLEGLSKKGLLKRIF